MTLCEHGCGTELDLEYEAPPIAHTPERCQAATRALLAEAISIACAASNDAERALREAGFL